MAVLPEAIVTHATSRRTRLRIPGKRGDEPFFSYLLIHLANLDGVDQVQTNSRTGSILIRHGGDPAAVFRQAEERHLFFVEPGERIEEAGPAAEGTFLLQMRRRFKELDQRTISGTEGRLDMASIGFLALLGAAGYDLLRGKAGRVPWYAALWYASAILFGIEAKAPDRPLPSGNE